MKENSILGPALIGIGIGCLVGITCASLLDGVIASVGSFAGAWIVEVQPFARSRKTARRTHWRGVPSSGSGQSNPPTQPPRDAPHFGSGPVYRQP